MTLASAYLPTPPPALAGLARLALDLRWTWSHAADALWERIDPEVWSLTRSPWLMLQLVPRARLEELARDATFVELCREHLAEHQRQLTEPGWFPRAHPETPLSVAYFSLEFGLSEALPIYSGGLGILAGDLLKTASDLDVPVVGVGLLYQRGYFRQGVDARGRQVESYPQNDPMQLPVVPLRNGTGDWLVVRVELPGRTVRLRAWEATVGRTRLYLLDSNDPLNEPVDRGITGELYGGNEENRLQQELVLGIGGWRLLMAIDREPAICHLNEGHCAFAVLERARTFMQRTACDFEVALSATRAGNVFTTHTPVEAGFDRFPPWLVAEYLRPVAAALNVELDRVLDLGRRSGDPDEPFNMAHLALRGAIAANAVSEPHRTVSRRIFAGLYPRWPEAEIPILAVTNGVHAPSWDSEAADELWTRHCGKDRWRGCEPAMADGIRRAPTDELWNCRNEGRRRLVDYARRRLHRQLRGRIDVEHVLDPDVLTLGFARRFTAYKRPGLLLTDPDRLVRLLDDPRRPVQIVVAGTAHPHDEAGKATVQAWVDFVRAGTARRHAVFIADYDMATAEHLVQGVDVWINAPLRGLEACGTSGMKVLVNGGLNLSSLDGWWAEAYDPRYGWALPGADGDAERLYEILEREVVPSFYERDEHDLPVRWLEKVRASMADLTPRYSMTRTLPEYVERMYLPALHRLAARTTHHANAALELVASARRIEDAWAEVRFGELAVSTRGDELCFRVPAYLDGLDASLVRVELYADPRHGGAPEIHPMRPIEPLGRGFIAACRIHTERPAADFTPRIVPAVCGLDVPLELSTIRWYERD
jgi:starch phosphorylase